MSLYVHYRSKQMVTCGRSDKNRVERIRIAAIYAHTGNTSPWNEDITNNMSGKLSVAPSHH